MIEQYFKRHKKVANYGIECLDNRLKGIMACELILIGARSGAGKSTIANMIATNNLDKRVVLISLESEENDMIMTEVYKRYRKETNRDIDKREFSMGAGTENKEILDRITQEEMEKNKNITAYYRSSEGFNINSMKDIITKEADKKAEMIIIDHIDYFDLHNPRENENRNISEIMRAIRTLQGEHDIPVVMISHLNKGNRETKIPTLEDFMGTSNKVKEATTVILFAPDDDGNLDNDGRIRRTWICVRKDRFAGYDNEVYNMGFDLDTREYENGYDVYRVNYWGTKVCKKGTMLYGNFQKSSDEGWK